MGYYYKYSGYTFSVEFLTLISDISYAVTLALAALVMIRRRRLKREQKWIALVVMLTFINHSLTLYFAEKGQNNLWLYHIYVPVMLVLMCFLYKERLKPLVTPKLFGYIAILFVGFTFVNSMFLQPMHTFNSNTVRLSAVIYIAFALAYFYRLMKEPPIGALHRVPMFWFNSGVLLYYSGTLVLFLVVDAIIKQSSDIMISSWVLNAAFNLLLLFSYTISLWLTPQT